MFNAGDYNVSSTVYMPFDSFAAATGAPAATTNFVAGDVQIYKNGGTTQRSSSAGITATTTFDSLTGLQMIVIDLSDNTDAGFYAAGSRYQVAVSDITVDGQTLRFWAGIFSIEIQPKVNMTQILGTAVSTPATAGILDVNLKNIANAAVSTSTAQLGVNAVQAGGTAWGSGAITAASIAADAITAAKVADGTIDAATFAASAITATAIAADAITAAKIANGAIDAATFAANAIDAAALATDAVNEIAAAVTAASPTIQDVVDGVWDEPIADHLDSGSTGASLNGAGAAGDPWTTTLPGAYGAGTAGFIVGTNLDDTVSSRATQTSVNTIDDFLDTEITDIRNRIPAALVGGRIDANVGAISSDATAADNAEAFFDGTGYAGTNNVIPLVTVTSTATALTTNNDKTGYTLTTADKQDAADEFLNRNLAGGGSGNTRNIRNALRRLRNRVAIAAGTATVYTENDSSTAWTAAVTTTPGDPVSEVDPA